MYTFAPTGIAGIGEVPWGSHVCQFFSGASDLRDILVPYFKAGLENNEQCLMVATEPFSADDARAALRAAVADFDAREKRGQIAIHDVRAWYDSDSVIDGDEIVAGLLTSEAQARADGYTGFRTHGNIGWLARHQWNDFRDYEAGVSRALKGRRMISMCSYCLDTCEPRDVLDVVTNHGFAVTKSDGWSCVEIVPVQAKDELVLQPRAVALPADRELGALLEYLPAAFYTTDANGCLTSFNEAAARLWRRRPPYGAAVHDAFSMIAFDGEAVPPDQSPASIAIASGARVDGMEACIETPDGTQTPCAFYSTPIPDKDGGVAGTVNMMIDITRQKESHDRQSFLVRELDHRIKNNLATIQALAGATARNSKTVDEFQKAFMGRIGALSKTHSLITANDREHVSLKQLLDNELGMYDEGRRVTLSGPEIVLPAHIAVSYGMTIHELTTNALKYGALAVPGGQLDVSWRSEGARLTLRWKESNVPIGAQPSRVGFGTQLLRRLLPQQLGAEVDIRFEPDGLNATIAIELT
jgi:two-component sensor histidine kinase